jgi:hypothetical protein
MKLGTRIAVLGLGVLLRSFDIKLSLKFRRGIRNERRPGRVPEQNCSRLAAVDYIWKNVPMRH